MLALPGKVRTAGVVDAEEFLLRIGDKWSELVIIANRMDQGGGREKFHYPDSVRQPRTTAEDRRQRSAKKGRGNNFWVRDRSRQAVFGGVGSRFFRQRKREEDLLFSADCW